MLSKKYNYDNYIEFDTEYRDLFSKFNDNGLINIYDVLTIRKQLPEELLIQLKRKHIQSEFSFKNIVQDDEVKHIKPKTKEEIEQERIERFEELKKIEREKRESLIELAKQQEITKTIRDNIIKADEIRRLTSEFDSWLKTVCELVHLSRILQYDDDLIEIQKDITNDLKEIDPKTKIQSNMFGFKGKTYEDLLIMLSGMFKKEELEEIKQEEDEEDFESGDDFGFEYDTEEDNEFETDEELVGNYNHDYDEDLEMYSVKYDRSKLWDSKRRKDNKVKSNKRFVNFRDKKKQDGLKGGNLEHRKKIFYYLVSLFDEIYDSHIDQNKQRIENILICEAYICMYNVDSFDDIDLNNFKSNSVFDNVFTGVVDMYKLKDSRKKEFYNKLFKGELHFYNLPYVSRNNLLSLDCVKFIKEFVNRIKNKDELLKYKKKLIIGDVIIENDTKWNDQIDMNVEMYEKYKEILDKEFIEKINKYDINFYTNGLSNLIQGNLTNMNSYKIKEQSYDLDDSRYNFETLISKLEISYKYNFDVSDFYDKFVEIINETYDFEEFESKSNFYNERFKELVKMYDSTKYEVIKNVIEHYADPKLFDADFNLLVDKLKVSYKYNFDVSDFKRKFIEVINKTYDFNKIESKSKFYDEQFTRLIGLYDETKFEVIKNVIKHYADPELFDADIAKGGNVIIRKLYTDFHKTTEGYNLIKDYLKERIAYWIKCTNLETYDRIFEYIEKYKEFTVTLHNKIVDKLDKDHKEEDKNLKIYFETKVKQYKDERFIEIVIVKEKLTSIIKDLIPQCEIYVINYYNDEQLKDFKENIGKRVKELITDYYIKLSVDDFKINNPKDEDSDTLIITAFKDKDYGLNQQFYVNNDNKVKINLWKDFEEHYRDCVVNKLKEIAVDLSFEDITYILFVSFRMQLVRESWVDQILKIEKINETIEDHLTNKLISVGDCINYLTASINVASSSILKHFFCIDKIAEIIKKICESDPNFDFDQYESLIDNEDLSDEVREEIVKAMSHKLIDLFERKLKESPIDDYIKEYDDRKDDDRYVQALQDVVYNKLYKEIFVENDFEKTKKKFTELNKKYENYFKFQDCNLYRFYFEAVNKHYGQLYEVSLGNEDNAEKEEIAREAISEFSNWIESDAKEFLNEYIIGWYSELVGNCGLDFYKLIDLTTDNLFVNYYNFSRGNNYFRQIGKTIYEDTLPDLIKKYDKITATLANSVKKYDKITATEINYTSEIIEIFKSSYRIAFEEYKHDLNELLISYKTYMINDFKQIINKKFKSLIVDNEQDSNIVFNIVMENYSSDDYSDLKKSFFKLITSRIEDEEEIQTLNNWYINSEKEQQIQNAVKDEITSYSLTDNNILTWYFNDELVDNETIKPLYQNIIKENADQFTEGVKGLEVNKIITLYEDLNKFEDIVKDKIKSNYRDVYNVIEEYDRKAVLKINELFVTVLTSILKDKSTPINDYYELLNFISSM